MAQRSAARPARRSRRGLPAAAALITGALLAGCSATNPITTQLNYDPSDGVSTGDELGDVSVGNLILLTSAEGAPGTVVGYATNSGREDTTITITLGSDGGSPFDVAAGQTVLIGPDGDETFDVEASPTAPGTNVPVTVSAGNGGTTSMVIPVLDGTLPEYADLVP